VKHTHTLVAALALAVMSLALVACSSSSSDMPLTRAQLIAKADPICRTVVRTVRYYQLTPKKIVSSAPRLADVEEHAYAELSKLTPPVSFVDDWRFIVDGFRESARDFRRLAHLAEPNNENGQFETLYADVRQKAWKARENGFKDCGKY
jgi:hypothetical protein